MEEGLEPSAPAIKLVTELVKPLEQWGVTEKKSHPPHSSLVFLKPDRTWHMTTDHRALNKATGLLTAPVPRMVDRNAIFLGWEYYL